MQGISEAVTTIGPAGVVLVALLLASLYFSIRNVIYLWVVGHGFRKVFERIESGRSDYAKELCGEVENPLVDIIASIIKTHAAHSKDLRAEVAYLFHRNFESVNNGLTYLRLISVISPLLGLLGTMLGLVGVFKVVAAQAVPDSALLAGGIWEALLTTIMGLSVAIPSLVFAYWLGLKLKGFRIEAIEHSYRALELYGTTCGLDERESEAEERRGAAEKSRALGPRVLDRAAAAGAVNE